MITDNLKKINLVLQLKQLRREGAAMLKGKEQKDFIKIQEKHDHQRAITERLYNHEYTTRVGIATRKLQDEAGAKKRDFKPSFFGIDCFNKSDLSRQAQLNVRFDHQQTMDRLGGQELKESKSFLEKSSQRKTYLEDFKRSTERRRTQTRRQTSERRRSPTMSD